MRNRRLFERHSIQVPLSVSTSVRRDRVAVTRDVSASGMLFHSPSKFTIGERVTLQFRLAERRGVTAGIVVRSEGNTTADPLFRFLTAVRFDAPLLDLRL